MEENVGLDIELDVSKEVDVSTSQTSKHYYQQHSAKFTGVLQMLTASIDRQHHEADINSNS